MVADRLKWFGDEESDVESILAAKGETVIRSLTGKPRRPSCDISQGRGREPLPFQRGGWSLFVTCLFRRNRLGCCMFVSAAAAHLLDIEGVDAASSN